MFTGIIEELGKVKRVVRSGRVMLLEVAAQKTLQDAGLGDSIAVNGVCLTITSLSVNTFSLKLSRKPLKKQILGYLKPAKK